MPVNDSVIAGSPLEWELERGVLMAKGRGKDRK